MYRTTPLEVGYSPSQLLMGRVLRTTVPTTRVQRKPQIPDLTSVQREDEKIKARQKRNFDSHHGARTLPPLQPGDQVWLPGRESEAEVGREVAPQSYEVGNEDGVFRRNRQDLIRLPSSEGDKPQSCEPQNRQAETTETEQSTTDKQSESPTSPQASPKSRRSSHHSRPPNHLDLSW